MRKIAVTMGDPAGIGAEIILKSLKDFSDYSDIILVGNREIFNRNEKISNIKLPENIEFIDIPYDVNKVQNAAESSYSGELSYFCLKKACELVNKGIVKGIATAPLSKNALNLAGYNYSGQTEILEEELSTGSKKAQMLFVSDNLKILLLTRHISLRSVPDFITGENIINTAEIFNKELREKFNIKSPKIAMCALNPHAGENGLLGGEELKVIKPAIDKLKNMNINISGPYSADTLLGKAVLNSKSPDFDGYIACYHDQALPAIKSLGLEKVLNVTIGLKALRVSPSHGTAFDIAYQNKADYKSMLNAIEFLRNNIV